MVIATLYTHVIHYNSQHFKNFIYQWEHHCIKTNYHFLQFPQTLYHFIVL